MVGAAPAPAGGLTPLQLYTFETSGWVVLRGVLGRGDSDTWSPRRIATELDAGGDRKEAMADQLAEHPSLVAALNELMDDLTFSGLPGDKVGDAKPEAGFFSRLNFNNAPRMFGLLERPVLHENVDEAAVSDRQPRPPLQQWAAGLHDPSRAYSHDRGTRVCSAVRCVWVLPPRHTQQRRQAMLTSEDTGHQCYALIPGSHTADHPTPSSILRTGYDDSELVTLPLLRVGDLLLHAATVVHAVRLSTGCTGDVQSSPHPRLLTADFVTTLTGNWPVEGPAPDNPPRWLLRLSPTQQAALGLHRSGASTVHDFGSRVSVLAPSLARTACENLRAYEERAVGEAARLHPPIPTMTTDMHQAQCELLEEDVVEMYQWDCCGHLILRNVMDAPWLDAALAAIEFLKHPMPDSVKPETFHPLPEGALLGLPEPHAAPFARMLDHPAITRRLQWILGPGWVVEGPPAPTTASAGGAPLAIHSGGAPTTPINLVRTKHGRSHCEVVKVAWQLRDVNLKGQRDGGYICIPGSHHARRQLPFGADFQREDPMADVNLGLREDGHLQLLSMRAGDVCIFMAASQTHGAAGWRDVDGRRAVIYGIWSRARARLRQAYAIGGNDNARL